MKNIWSGDITLNDAQTLQGITLSAAEETKPCNLEGVKLRVLSVVDTARIPLRMTVGSPHSVHTTHQDTETYFSSILLRQHASDAANVWWHNAMTHSPLGILVAVDRTRSLPASHRSPSVTELLFYASTASPARCDSPPTPPHSSPVLSHIELPTASHVRVFALPLCSDLCYDNYAAEKTPPSSPQVESDIQATFLPPLFPQLVEASERVNELHPRKRRSVNDAFDEATERRRKARKSGGEGVAAAAAPQMVSGEAVSLLKHRRSASSTHIPLQTRPLSRASSTASIRPPTAREASVPAASRTSGLSRMKSMSAPNDDSPERLSTEQKNKEHISKIVMAGLRLQGLVQRKSRKSRVNSAAASPIIDKDFDDMEVDREKDEEYKLVYHQVYKGTCFAFRQHIAVLALQSYTIPLQETVEKLLAIFSSDPLVVMPTNEADDFTPGGRKPFGSSALPISESRNPFLPAAAIVTDGDRSNTPCVRKPQNKAKS